MNASAKLMRRRGGSINGCVADLSWNESVSANANVESEEECGVGGGGGGGGGRGGGGSREEMEEEEREKDQVKHRSFRVWEVDHRYF